MGNFLAKDHLMKINRLNNGFITKEMRSPYVVEKDNEYLPCLEKLYKHVLAQATKAGADKKSLEIIRQYSSKILNALETYYMADIEQSNLIIRKLIEDVSSNPFAVSNLAESCAFPKSRNGEIQFYRCRIGNPTCDFSAKDLLHLPRSARSKAGNYRFSIPGNPSLYLANSSYGCWIETGFPSEIEFNVSPLLLDDSQKILNLAVYVRDFGNLNDLANDRVHCWLKLLMLTIASSFRIKEEGRCFRSEYIVPQLIMMSCKKIGLDGIAYFSTRVSDVAFARCAINLALFVEYEDEGSSLVRHMKIGDPTNYFLYKQLLPSIKQSDYELASINHPFITNIGKYENQHPYQETEFFEFDKYLFKTWSDQRHKAGKDDI